MKKIAIALVAAAVAAGSAAGGGRHYIYRGGHYHPPRGYPIHTPRYYGGFGGYGYSPSFSLGVYRPAAYLGGAGCDLARSVYYGRYRDPRSYPVVLSLPVSSEVVRANFSDMIFNVSPAKASVYVDGKLIGSARSFATERDRFMILQGEHDLRIEYPGFESFSATLDVVANRTLRIDVQLNSLDPRAESRR